MAADEQRQIAATDSVTKSAPNKSPEPSQKIWQEAYDLHAPVQTARIDAPAKVKPEISAAQQCVPPNDSYLKFINQALSEAYDPSKFGKDPEVVRHEFDCQIHSEADARKFAAIVLKRSGDSHTQILSPSENLAMKSEEDPKAVGFGLRTNFDASFSTPGQNHGVAVVRAYPGGTGAEAGLKPGDEILSVDSQDLTKLSYEAANKKLHGVAGSIARLVVQRDGQQPFNLDVERKSSNIPDVTDVSLPNKLAYISIDDFFNKNLPRQLETALKKHDDARGFIIDLRQNGGGSVDLQNLALSEVMTDGDILKSRERNLDDKSQVSYTTRLYKLTPKGIEVTETSDTPASITLQLGDSNDSVTFPRASIPKVKMHARMANLVGNRPVEILTDERTASAAEMFTGAAHDTGHARTAGTFTYGKGIEGLYADSMPQNAGEVISNGRWWTPAGHWAGDAEKKRHGLKPDVEIHNSYGAIPLTANDKQLAAGILDLENTLSQKSH